MSRIWTFWDDSRGATSIEYALIGGLVSLLIVVGVTAIGNNLSSHYYTPLNSKLT